ncbi:trehalose-phosphatase [Xanthobacter pseudotagetidis]|uniref:trehalose-phosphatase n=1 Tax=Xanthobacter pseudotagetidis TaxID=3119911 RepID=UPI00372759A3
MQPSAARVRAFEPRRATLLDPGTHALFLDVDGTLIDIAPHPDAVRVPEGLVGLLGSLSTRFGGALALVSGRTVARLDALFAPLALPAAGVHGAEIRLDAGGPVTSAVPPFPERLRQGLNDLARRFDGVFTEDKTCAVAVHYRAAPDAGPLLGAEIAALVEACGRGYGVLAGQMVFEVKPEEHDKGSAVAAFLTQPAFAGRTPVFVGDDVTDEAGFLAARAYGGAAVSVGRRLPDVDTVLPDAGAVRDWLAGLAAGTVR